MLGVYFMTMVGLAIGFAAGALYAEHRTKETK